MVIVMTIIFCDWIIFSCLVRGRDRKIGTLVIVGV